MESARLLKHFSGQAIYLFGVVGIADKRLVDAGGLPTLCPIIP